MLDCAPLPRSGRIATETVQDDELIQRLKAIVGAEHVLTDSADLTDYGGDRAQLGPPRPVAAVLPGSIEQAIALVRLAYAERLSLVPAGGRTGLSAGALAADGELVVAMDRLNRVLHFDAVDRTVTCQAGVVTAQLQVFARAQGLYYPVDFAATGKIGRAHV